MGSRNRTQLKTCNGKIKITGKSSLFNDFLLWFLSFSRNGTVGEYLGMCTMRNVALYVLYTWSKIAKKQREEAVCSLGWENRQQAQGEKKKTPSEGQLSSSSICNNTGRQLISGLCVFCACLCVGCTFLLPNTFERVAGLLLPSLQFVVVSFRCNINTLSLRLKSAR